ncbi:hypothetical protein HanXRQr2_Chr13g0614171 [Helianthus annuus]|uniref:Uncharacterized protein n=1 Tax=Helianthus annuus TaxID=4232 RepID=A0A9K3EP82_HELAN|nr:hypothetical protein HanXRQr2_Chr13g0614171 [Helianthus annuus]KAJ0851358.1 hypothetical protein HanPSC8_Chr13g0591291 [Helianthus annuus]
MLPSLCRLSAPHITLIGVKLASVITRFNTLVAWSLSGPISSDLLSV